MRTAHVRDMQHALLLPQAVPGKYTTDRDEPLRDVFDEAARRASLSIPRFNTRSLTDAGTPGIH